MAITEAALQALIQAEGYGTDSATAQAAAIQSTWRTVLAQRRWTFLETTATVSAVVGVATVSLAGLTDLARIDAARIAFGSETYDLTYDLPQRLLAELQLDGPTDTGAPERWSYHAGALLLWPRPNRAYTVTVNYLRQPAYSAAAIVFPEAHQDVLVWGAVAKLAFRQRDWNQATYAKNEYAEQLKALIQQDSMTQRQNSLTIAQSSFYDDIA